MSYSLSYSNDHGFLTNHCTFEIAINELGYEIYSDFNV